MTEEKDQTNTNNQSMNFYQEIKEIFDKWAKDFQEMPEGEEKNKERTKMKKTLDWFYGAIQIDSIDPDEK